MLGLRSTFVVIFCEQTEQIIRTGSLPNRGWESGEHLLILTSLNSNSDIFRFFKAVERCTLVFDFTKFFQICLLQKIIY